MRKVLFYCHVFYPESSGYSHAFQNLINSLLDYYNDLQITVVTPYPLGKDEREIEKENLNIIRLRPFTQIRKIRYFLNDFFYAKNLSTIFKNGKYDLLFVETFDPFIILNNLDNDIYKSLVVRIHSTNETEYTFFEKGIDFYLRKLIINFFLTKKIKWILSTNSYHIDFAKEYYFEKNIIQIANANFMVLPNPVSVLRPSSLEILDKKMKFFVLGRIDYLGNNQKGFIDLIYALNLLDKSLQEKISIKIVGKGNMREKLINLSRGIKNITFIEEMTHDSVLKELQKSDVVILPSRYEGLSMFALEALATGNICIFSKTGGLIDMIDGNGILFEPQNIEQLSDSIVKIIHKSKDEIIQMKKRSIEICEKKFSPKVVSSKFNTISKIIQESKQCVE